MNLYLYQKLSKSLFLFFISLFPLILSATDLDRVSLTQNEQRWIANHHEVIVGVGPDWAPFDFVSSDGNYSGIANDYLNLISGYTGLKFKCVVDQWSHNLEKIKKREIDLLDAVYYSDERDTYMSFTHSYLEILDYFYIRDDLNIKTLKDLDGKTVAIPKGYAHADDIRKEFPKIKILTVKNFSESIDAVLEKRADMLFDTQIALSYKLEQDGIRDIIPFHSYRKHGLTKLYMSSYKGNDTLVSIVNKGLDAITKEQSREIYTKWVNPQVDKDSSQSSRVSFTDQEREWIKSHPKLTYSEVNWKPMSIIEDGTMKGIMAEYLDEITKQTGIAFEYVNAKSWPDVLEKFKKKQIDIIPGVGESDYESKLGLVSDVYANFPFVLVTKNNQSFISSLDELDGKSIAVPKYWTSYNYLKENKPNIKIIATNNIFEALDLVKSSKADAFLGHLAIGMYYVGTYYSHSLHIAGRVAYNFNHKILIQKEDKVLQSIINKVIDSMDEKRKLDIKEKWLHVAVNEVQDYTLLYQIISVFVLFLLGTFYWNRRLTREIRERKKIEKRLEREKENFKLLFEKVSNGNLIIQNGHFVNANDAALKMLGLKEIKTLLDSSPSNWSPEFQADGTSSSKKSLEYMCECLENGSSRFEWLHCDVEGREFWVDVGLTKIQYENSKAIYVVWHDINEQKSLHHKLLEAKRNAEAANKSKSEFLANMSHEIRTPMNAIIGFTELLNEQLTEPRLRAYTKTIQSAGNSLLTLINDILDLSKIEAGKLEIKRTPTNLFNLINEISSIFTMAVKNKGLELIVDVSQEIPESLLVDEVRLRQILFNLIGNAVKFTDEGFIKLSVKVFNVDEHLSKLDVEIEVEDSGIGIPQEQIEKIFNQFEQTEGQDSRKFGGTGLGLSISKRLSEMMGGKISARSKEEGGAIFRVELFHIDISSVIPQSIQDSSEDLETIVFEPARVLVVDDIQNNRELIIKNFENSALEIITADDGLEALNTFKEISPDLVLMDIRMPVMDGYEAAQEMKKISPITPIVALTASVMEGEHKKLQSKDFDGYLRKPVLKQELFKELSRFLAFEALESKSENNVEENFELSSKAKESLEEILESISSQIAPLHSKVSKTNNISDVEKFAKSVSLLAEEYEIEFLKNYSDNLFEAVDVFDILEIQKLTKEFPNLLEKLKV